MKKKVSSQSKKSSSNAFLIFSIALLYVGLGGLAYLYSSQKSVDNSQAVQQSLQAQINENKKIYIYNLEEVLRKINALETKKKFEDEIIKLNDELLEAEKKIKSLKSAKVKEDFAEVYLNNLRMKRDEIVDNYEKNIEELTSKINAALAEIAQEKNIPTIFVQQAVALNTNFVVDLTDEVAARIQK